MQCSLCGHDKAHKHGRTAKGVQPGLFHSNWEVDMLDRLSPSTLDIRCLNLPLSKPLATSPMLDGLPDNVISKRFVCPYLP